MANELDDEHYYEVLQKIEVLEAKDEFKRLLKADKDFEPSTNHDWSLHE